MIEEALLGVHGAIAAAIAAARRAKERRDQVRDALRRHHPAVRQLVLIASDDLIVGFLNRSGLKTGNGNRVPASASHKCARNYHIPVFKPADGGVVWSPPGRVPVGLLHRQIEIVLVEPAKRLSRAAQFLDLVEHHLDRFLDTPIRVFLITVAGLHEADRRCHNQLAPARLLIACRERALSQQIRFVLVEAALEPEQQAVVAVPRRVDGLLIDQNRYRPRGTSR
ncbi:hypothetical protein [Bradyrhizobium sp. 139]|uniref:hypothetical protein n=1 Tax=Bradyrhizobium sp. 139 TaxID=2782616 RepID=UPI001FF997C9|nr:hypothetical protein [Bradyrhizobium sp. 139]